jgi:hypothetical protein
MEMGKIKSEILYSNHGNWKNGISPKTRFAALLKN